MANASKSEEYASTPVDADMGGKTVLTPNQQAEVCGEGGGLVT